MALLEGIDNVGSLGVLEQRKQLEPLVAAHAEGALAVVQDRERRVKGQQRNAGGIEVLGDGCEVRVAGAEREAEEHEAERKGVARLALERAGLGEAQKGFAEARRGRGHCFRGMVVALYMRVFGTCVQVMPAELLRAFYAK